MMMQLTKDALSQIQRLYVSIDKVDELITFYKDVKGPAYLTCNYYKGATSDVQLHTDIMIDALSEQRARYISALNSLGIDYVGNQK